MIELTTDPMAMVDAALSRLQSGDGGLNTVIADSLDRAADAAQSSAFSAGDFYGGAFTIHGKSLADSISLLAGGFSGGTAEVLKTVSFFVSLVLLILFFSIWLRTYTLNKPDRSITEQLAPPEPAPGGPMSARWQEVLRHLDSVREAEWKFAIIEADKLVDDALKKAGYIGESFADRLERMQPGQLANMDALWEAHRLRNRIAHEVNYFLRYTEAKHAITSYDQTLRQLGSL